MKHIVAMAEEYLANNAAESGADELIRQLVSALKMPETGRQDCCDITASVPCSDCPQRKPDAWQVRDKHGRWITLPGDWQESENIEGHEYRPLYALPPSGG